MRAHHGYHPAAYWAMDPDALRGFLRLLSSAQTIPPARSLQAIDAQPGAPLAGTQLATTREGVVTIPIRGVLFQFENFFTALGLGTAMETIARDLEVARHASDVRGILLAIDSPGGELGGTQETAALIAETNQTTPVLAHISSMGSSGAYWLASQAESISIGSTGLAGSIGVRTTILDDSEALKRAGLQEIVIVSSQSPRKDLDATTDAGRADLQAIVDRLAEPFLAEVARGREVNLETVLMEFGQGGVFVGSEAVAAGLVDHVETFAGSQARFVAQPSRSPRATAIRTLSRRSSHQESRLMSSPLQGEVTVAELEAAYPAVLTALRQQIATIARLDGATAERARILAIQALSSPGVETLVAEAVQDPAATSATLAERILVAQRDQRAERLAQLSADTLDGPMGVASGHAPPPREESPERQFISQAKASFQRHNTFRA